ncbi:MAG TPA: threonine synthase [Ktedonobacterales bacterium]|nr:threonine synthase [Ktedonobacterales bacterium]
MNIHLLCSACGRAHDPASLLSRCPCGGLLDVAEFEAHFPLERIRERPPTLWRYLEALPFAPESTAWQAVTMGEGFTPLVRLAPDTPHILLKVDYMMPTLSFKDRGAAVLVAHARALGVQRVIADSSGNAGTAIAAYAARAGIACDVYVPASASAKKLRQIAAHGAAVHAIPGSREDTAAAAIAAVEREQVFYASHVYHPFFFQGTKTYAYEIWEQLGGAPDVLVLPVGNGTLVLGAYYGFKDLLRAGLIERLPRILAVQAEGCAPLAQAFARGEDVAAPVINTGTEAEGIAIAAPERGRQILAAVRDTHGLIITVSDAAIEEARTHLARRGFYVEPTAAAPYAGLVEYTARSLGQQTLPAHQPLFSSNPLSGPTNERVVVPLCGAGLKAG